TEITASSSSIRRRSSSREHAYGHRPPKWGSRSSLRPRDDDAGVVADAEAVDERLRAVQPAHLVGHHFELAARGILLGEVERRRDQAGLQAEDRRDRRERARGAERVPERREDRGYPEPIFVR